MPYAVRTLMLSFCAFAISSCNSNESADIKKLRDELAATNAAVAHLKAELEALKAQGGDLTATEVEFTDSGDFSRANDLGKFEFSYKKVFARAPELVIERPKEPEGFYQYEVTERRLDGFTIQVGSFNFKNSREELPVYLKNMKWRVKGMVARAGK